MLFPYETDIVKRTHGIIVVVVYFCKGLSLQAVAPSEDLYRYSVAVFNCVPSLLLLLG